jgi:hypothetical protein
MSSVSNQQKIEAAAAIVEANKYNVCFGAGQRLNAMRKNSPYRKLVEELAVFHSQEAVGFKSNFIRQRIVDEIHKHGGKFYSWCDESGCWVEADKRETFTVVSQALRDQFKSVRPAATVSGSQQPSISPPVSKASTAAVAVRPAPPVGDVVAIDSFLPPDVQTRGITISSVDVGEAVAGGVSHAGAGCSGTDRRDSTYDDRHGYDEERKDGTSLVCEAIIGHENRLRNLRTMIEDNRLAGRPTVSPESDGVRTALAMVEEALRTLEKEIGTSND